MEILIAWAASSILCFSIVIGTESFIIPKLSSTSKFKKWWRRHVIGCYEE